MLEPERVIPHGTAWPRLKEEPGGQSSTVGAHFTFTQWKILTELMLFCKKKRRGEGKREIKKIKKGAHESFIPKKMKLDVRARENAEGVRHGTFHYLWARILTGRTFSSHP